jgi:CRISPR/Cas system-associated exonuclease Cas4 (RecB family)
MTDTDLLLKFAPWSISKAGCAITCPRQFGLKYVDKVPEEAPRSENKVGTVAHAVLENRLKGKPAREAKTSAVEKTPLTSTEEEQLKTLEDGINEFMKRFDAFCKANGVTELLIEKKWAINAALSPVSFFSKDVFFRGVVDLAVLTKDRDLIVVDHKSGTVASSLSKFKPQLDSYAVLGLATTPDIAGVQSAIHFLQGNGDAKIKWNKYIDANLIKTQLNPWLISYLTEAAKSAKDTTVTKPGKNWPCGWCAYRLSCPDSKAK